MLHFPSYRFDDKDFRQHQISVLRDLQNYLLRVIVIKGLKSAIIWSLFIF